MDIRRLRRMGFVHGLWLLGLALCGATDGIAQPRIDVAATPAWNGWTRPGRATEVDIRLSAGTATRATLDVVAGRQVTRASVDLEPGRIVRLQVPIESADGVAVSAGSPGAPPRRHEVRTAHSESPLLGVGLVTGEPVQLEGFHAVALGADDLPRNASAYSSIDALILDAPTLGALDERQLGALLAHAAECGRIVLLNADSAVRRVLGGTGGCGGHALMHASSLGDARAMLQSSLAVPMATPISLAGLGELARPDLVTWDRVLVVLVAYFAAATLAAMFFSSLPVLLLVPAGVTVAVWALLNVLQPTPQLVVWSEAESGARAARYQAWQRIPGLARGRTRVPVLPQLASARSCDPPRPIRLDFDATRGRATFAEFDTRLFRQISICYSGSFPIARAIAVDARADGAIDVRNAGTLGWPTGVFLSGRLANNLPALGPGEYARLSTREANADLGAGARTAVSRIEANGLAALWPLDLGGVAGIPMDAKAWLLLFTPPL